MSYDESSDASMPLMKIVHDGVGVGVCCRARIEKSNQRQCLVGIHVR